MRVAFAALLAVSLAVTIVHTQGAGAALAAGSGSSRVASATVMAAYHVHRGPARTDVLDLLVLLRGSPAWFNRTGRAGILSGGRSSAPGGHATASYWATAGGITTTFDTDSELGTVHVSVVSSTGSIFDRQIVPSEINIVLIDNIDGREHFGRDPTVETRLIDPRLDDGDTVASVMKRSPALFEFLQCDVTVAGAPGVPDALAAVAAPDSPITGLRAMMPAVCNEMRP